VSGEERFFDEEDDDEDDVPMLKTLDDKTDAFSSLGAAAADVAATTAVDALEDAFLALPRLTVVGARSTSSKTAIGVLRVLLFIIFRRAFIADERCSGSPCLELPSPSQDID